MKILLKFLYINIMERKLRTFLILISILLSTALFFASNAISNSFTQTIVAQLKSTFGKATIVVKSKDDAASPFVAERMIKSNPSIVNWMGIFTLGGGFENEKEKVGFSLFASELSDFKNFNTLDLVNVAELEPFRGRKIIVSQDFARENGFRAGDFLPLQLRGGEYKLKIVGISKPNFFFGDESQRRVGIIPKNFASDILGSNGNVSAIYIQTKEGTQLKDFVEVLSKELERYDVKVEEAVNDVDIAQRTRNVSIPFLMISILVLIMSVFIIYTSFKVITVERLPIMGTFRSIGATKKSTRNVLLLESIFYGAIGGLLGIPLGYLVLSLVLKVFSSGNPRGLQIEIAISFSNVLISFLLAFFISFISAYIPIYKSSKLPLKNLVLGMVEKKKERKAGRLYMGVAGMIISLILPFVVPVEFAVPVGGLCVFTLIGCILYTVPLMVKLAIPFFEKLFGRLTGNYGLIAVKNMRDNDNINQNISLLTISISTLLLVFILSATLQELVANTFLGSKYNVTSTGSGIDKTFVNRVRALKSVDRIYPVYEASDVKVVGSDVKLRLVEGVNEAYVTDFFDIPLKKGKLEPLLEQIQKERTLLMTEATMTKLKVKENDYVTLDTPRGNKKYKVIATLSLNRTDAMGGAKFIKSDFELSTYNFLAVKASDPKLAVEEIKDLYGEKNNFTSSIPDLVNRVKGVLTNLFGILKGFSLVLLVIGIFGIMNNLIINFIQRKRSIAMYKSVGMSKKGVSTTTLIEAFTSGVMGSGLAICTTLLELVLVSKILKVQFGVVPIEYPPVLFISAFLVGIAVTVVGSIAPLIKGSKLKIIEAIKYE